MSVHTVLVANRGEIAVRVIRACRDLGLSTVAVHSTTDADSAAVRLADRAVQIGPGPARRSYLYVPAILEAARATGADAVHPGYGFLSEDPDFAEACEQEGLTFIGPPARVMRLLGDKTSARSAMAAAGLPVLPGSGTALADAAAARACADSLGFPVIIKAAAGGGGRGMHLVEHPDQLASGFARARAGARAAFADDRVYVERYLRRVRHVEVQVLSDTLGNAVALGARDCSVQRMHQKLVEETPPPGLPGSVVRAMEDAALAGVRAAGYVGAGTVEFLLDEDQQFWFLEVNCRLQVEHPVTEMVTGVDLVREQLLIADGRPLSLTAADVVGTGVAIECRINAEDPGHGFRPTPGRIAEWEVPGGPFVRVDTHVRAGHEIPADYDSLLAKIIAWGPDRDRALARMRGALAELHVTGDRVVTTTEFLRTVLDSAAFRAGRHDTALVAQLLDRRTDQPSG
jgi:acetyl-CoA carboxylase biotin carboxylase subunit